MVRRVGELEIGDGFRTLLTSRTGLVADKGLPGGSGAGYGVEVLWANGETKILHPDVRVSTESKDDE